MNNVRRESVSVFNAEQPLSFSGFPSNTKILEISVNLCGLATNVFLPHFLFFCAAKFLVSNLSFQRGVIHATWPFL